MRNQRSSLRHRRDDQGRFTDHDRFPASLGVIRRILHGGLDQHSRRALAERTAGEVLRQSKVEMVDALAIGLAFNRSRFELRHVHSRSFNGNLGIIDGFAEEIIGANGAGHLVSRTIAVRLIGTRPGLPAREIDRDFEFRQNVAFDAQAGYLLFNLHQRPADDASPDSLHRPARIPRTRRRSCRSAWPS